MWSELGVDLRQRDMAKAYEDNLREKLLSAYHRGEGSLSELADRFVMSLGWTKKISAQRRRTGKTARVPHHPGRKLHAGTETEQQVLS